MAKKEGQKSSKKGGDSARKDFRVDDMIPVRDTPITTEEFEQKKIQVDARSRQSAMMQQLMGQDVFNNDVRDRLNPELSEAMGKLDAKLNFLIGANMLNQIDQSGMEDRPINLSCAGAALVPTHQYKRGDAIELSMVLATFPPTNMSLIGKVMWVRKKESGDPFIGVKFIFRDKAEEESMARYIFKRNRESIRLKRLEEQND